MKLGNHMSFPTRRRPISGGDRVVRKAAMEDRGGCHREVPLI